MSEHHQGNLKHGKATLYLQARGIALGNVVKIEVREVEVLRRQWAQYPGAVDCRYVQPRHRNWQRYTEGYRPYLVVLDGWGHPDPDSPWVKERESNDCTVSEGRYSSCSSGWTRDFDTNLTAYLAATPSVTVLGDYRHTAGLDGYDATAKAEFDAQQVESVRVQLVAAGIGENLASEVAELFVSKSPNWAAGVLCQEHYSCTVSEGKRTAQAIHFFGEHTVEGGAIIEPEEFFAKAS